MRFGTLGAAPNSTLLAVSANICGGCGFGAPGRSTLSSSLVGRFAKPARLLDVAACPRICEMPVQAATRLSQEVSVAEPLEHPTWCDRPRCTAGGADGAHKGIVHVVE